MMMRRSYRKDILLIKIGQFTLELGLWTARESISAVIDPEDRAYNQRKDIM